MKLKRGLVIAMSIALIVGFTVACEKQEVQLEANTTENTTQEIQTVEINKQESPDNQYSKGSDVRVVLGKEEVNISEEGLSKELIATYWFNEDTDFKGFEKVADEIMEEGKTPGLGVRKLHEKGITGKGVNVAIIDQPIALDHPEYKGKIVEYKNLCGEEGGESSMHGPAVASLLAGNTIGVSPHVNIYYAAAPSWTQDAAYQADALKWIIERNRELPKDNKIRVVSVSAAPSGHGSPFNKNNRQWDEAMVLAKDEGLLVLDCTTTYGKIGNCYYDGKDRENGSTYIAGYLGQKIVNVEGVKKTILAPMCYRTTAESYKQGSYSYQYMANGGLSWAIPYAAGTLALGWQIDPTLTSEDIMQLLDETATINQEGYKIINPTIFVEAVQARAER